VAATPDAIDPAARPWILASFADGDGLQVEPWVECDGEFAQHGFVPRDGSAVILGEPTRQTCDASGAWKGSERTSDLDRDERTALAAATLAAGQALADAGYFGPFGVDAYRYRTASGVAFNPRSEINARYSMGWAVGMGSLRPDLLELP
jgi:hypothetical protein